MDLSMCVSIGIFLYICTYLTISDTKPLHRQSFLLPLHRKLNIATPIVVIISVIIVITVIIVISQSIIIIIITIISIAGLFLSLHVGDNLSFWKRNPS